MITLLVSRGADVNVQDDLGRTTLSYASEMRFNDVIRILLRNNVNPDLADRLGNVLTDFSFARLTYHNHTTRNIFRVINTLETVTNTHIHTHTHTHTHIQTYTRKHTFKNTHTYTKTHTVTRTRAHAHTTCIRS